MCNILDSRNDRFKDRSRTQFSPASTLIAVFFLKSTIQINKNKQMGQTKFPVNVKLLLLIDPTFPQSTEASRLRKNRFLAVVVQKLMETRLKYLPFHGC